MSPLEDTARILAEQLARRRAERDDFRARAAARGVEFRTPEEEERAFNSWKFAQKVEDRRRSIEEDEERNAKLSDDAPLRVVRAGEGRPSGAKWQAIVVKYREWLARDGNAGRRPDQAEIAAELRISARTLVDWLRTGCGVPIGDWRDVHALVLSEP